MLHGRGQVRKTGELPWRVGILHAHTGEASHCRLQKIRAVPVWLRPLVQPVCAAFVAELVLLCVGPGRLADHAARRVRLRLCS
eukprot:10978816-Alexandrium_andersonii.AAC.1